LTGETDLERAIIKLHRPDHELTCVTLGASGALMTDGKNIYREPAVAVTAVDTTGAGDIFRGAFIHALLRGDTPRAMLRFANAAAAISCTRRGAIDSVPTMADVDALTSDAAR
jgi:sugar/nucleoside kinase (ribokinase family)